MHRLFEAFGLLQSVSAERRLVYQQVPASTAGQTEIPEERKREIEDTFEKMKEQLGDKMKELLAKMEEIIGEMSQEEREALISMMNEWLQRKEKEEGPAPQSIDELNEKNALDMEVGTRLKDKEERVWEKTDEDQWRVTEGKDKDRTLSNEQMDKFHETGELPGAEELSPDDLDEILKDQPEVIRGIMKLIYLIIEMLKKIFGDGKIQTQEDIDRARKDVASQRQSIDNKLAQLDPSDPSYDERREELEEQRADLDDQDDQLDRREGEIEEIYDEAEENMENVCRQMDLTCRFDERKNVWHIDGDAPKIKYIHDQLEGVFGKGNMPSGWASIFDVAGKGKPEPTGKGLMRIPFNEETWSALAQLRPMPQAEKPPEDVGRYETVIGYPSSERDPKRWIIVSFPPELAEELMGLPEGSITVSSFMVRNEREGPFLPEGGMLNKDLRKMTREERRKTIDYTESEYEMVDALGIRFERMPYGTKVIVPSHLRGRGIKIKGVDVPAAPARRERPRGLTPGPSSQEQKSEKKTLRELPPDLEGGVTRVDKTGRFIQIDIGEDQRLLPGHTLHVWRTKPEPKYVGTVKVFTTEANLAVVQPLKTSGPVLPGDRVGAQVLVTRRSQAKEPAISPPSQQQRSADPEGKKSPEVPPKGKPMPIIGIVGRSGRAFIMLLPKSLSMTKSGRTVHVWRLEPEREYLGTAKARLQQRAVTGDAEEELPPERETTNTIELSFGGPIPLTRDDWKRGRIGIAFPPEGE